MIVMSDKSKLHMNRHREGFFVKMRLQLPVLSSFRDEGFDTVPCEEECRPILHGADYLNWHAKTVRFILGGQDKLVNKKSK
eukprot:Awhi_evm1s10246